jgi:hypothetical protein
MQTTEGFRIHATDHALKQILEKGFPVERIQETFQAPEKIYRNGKYEGQFRVTGNGLCLVGKPKGTTFTLITVYEDGVLTPPRPDQLETPEGQEYARRYAEGQARKNEYMPRVLSRRKAA